MIDLNNMAEHAYSVTKQRKSNGANIDVDTLFMLKHAAGEIIEATEAYTDLAYDTYESHACFERFQNEVADVVMCCLIIAENTQFDMEKALHRVMEKNKRRAEKQGDKL